MKLKVNDLIPEANIYILKDGEPKEQSIKETLGNSKILLFGLPGAYTSTCSKLHLPGYVKYAEKLKSILVGIQTNKLEDKHSWRYKV